MIDLVKLLVEIFVTFAKISLFNFGGGFVMISLIGDEIINQKEWITSEAFSNIIAISQVTPGAVAINTATYVGFVVKGVLGSLFATMAIPIPSFIIVILLSPTLIKYKDHGLNKMIFYGIRPVVVALILYAAYVIGKTTLVYEGAYKGFNHLLEYINFGSIGICIMSFFLLFKLKLNPILVIITSAVLGMIIFSF
jgi:chromate transporter